MLESRGILGAVRAGYVPEVDALRGLAMTAVILGHCKLMPFGWMGVWLFYVVSGFSVTTSLFGGRRREASAGAAIGGFYLRRALRIWPRGAAGHRRIAPNGRRLPQTWTSA